MKDCHLTYEYKRIGISVNDNFGLSEPVLVCLSTGTMHKIKEMSEDRVAPLCDKCEYSVGWMVGTPNYGVLNSLSSIKYTACRNCEKVLKK